MIALALTLAVQVTPVPPAEPEKDIVVIGRRLQNWRGSFRIKKGKYACQITQSSGDPQIDRIGCEAMRACLIPAMPRYEATRARGVDKAARQRMTEALNAELSACVADRRKVLIAEMADRPAGGGA